MPNFSQPFPDMPSMVASLLISFVIALAFIAWNGAILVTGGYWLNVLAYTLMLEGVNTMYFFLKNTIKWLWSKR